MAHEPTALKLLDTFTRTGGRGQRKWAVWCCRLRCPECGQEFVRLKNTLRGRRVRCIGTDRRTLSAS